MAKDTPIEFWHARHACGHAVYWSNPEIAVRTASSPCPWCGAENGKKVPQDVLMMRDSNIGIFSFREKLPDGRVPWPSDMPDAPDRIVIRHMADSSCCNN
jgi:hypothetical protein